MPSDTDSRKAPKAMAGYRVDNTRWPISSHRAPMVMRDVDITDMVASIDETLRRREPHAWVLELEDAVEIGAAQRRALAQQLRDRDDAFRKYCRAIGVVARTSTARGLLTALRWLAPAPCPERAFDTIREAEQWASTKLRATDGATG